MAEGGDGQDNEVRRKQEIKVTSTCMKKGGGWGGGGGGGEGGKRKEGWNEVGREGGYYLK